VLNGLAAQRLLALFCGGWLLLNFPLLGLLDVDVMVLGVPLFPVALLLLWATLIAALAWLMEHAAASDKED